MSFLAGILDLAGIVLITIGIVLDFVAAKQAQENNTTAASNYAKAAAGLSIIGLVLLIVGLIIGFFVNSAISKGLTVISENPDILKTLI